MRTILALAPHLFPMSPAKTYPTTSAGPHTPTLPISTSLLRIIPGNPRFAHPPLKPLFNHSLPKNLALRASLSSKASAIIRLPTGFDPIPDCYFDFDLDQLSASHLSICLHSLDDDDMHLAQTVLLAEDFLPKKGVLVRPLVNASGLPLAALTLDYQVITACVGAPRVWKEMSVPKFTGHRGMGSSGKKAPWRVLENMPESFLLAALTSEKVSTVELDIQLTRDGKTVVYHDWFIRPDGRRDKEAGDAVRMPIYSLRFDEFDELFRKLHRGVEVGTRVRKLVQQRKDMSDDVFDVGAWSLERLCELLPEEIGMLVELKYPAPNVKDALGIPYPEKNEYVDVVLSDLFGVERNQRREISFLSFDADICMLLAMKQSNYPVFLSHCEVLDKPCDEFDPRCTDVEEGLRFVKAQGFKGMMLFNEIVERKPEAVRKIVGAGYPIMTYGKRNSEVDFVRKQFELGVTGVIADDVDVLVKMIYK